MDKRAGQKFLEVNFTEFLDLIKVLKMLYGRDVAEKVFTKKLMEWYNIDSVSLTK